MRIRRRGIGGRDSESPMAVYVEGNGGSWARVAGIATAHTASATRRPASFLVAHARRPQATRPHAASQGYRGRRSRDQPHWRNWHCALSAGSPGLLCSCMPCPARAMGLPWQSRPQITSLLFEGGQHQQQRTSGHTGHRTSSSTAQGSGNIMHIRMRICMHASSIAAK